MARKKPIKKAITQAIVRLGRLDEHIDRIEDVTIQHCISELQQTFLELLKRE